MEDKKELEKRIRYQVACEERAHRIVERLLDNPVSEEYLLESGQLIKPEHYQDIVEERAISRLCGYPVCPNNIPELPKQKFHISTKTNKVYDITERKNFCSNQCYNASKYFMKQIPTSPLWMRRKEKPKPLELISLSMTSGACGVEVVTKTGEIQSEVNFLKKLDKMQNKESKKQENIDPESLNKESQKQENIDPESLKMDQLSISCEEEGFDYCGSVDMSTKRLKGQQTKSECGVKGSEERQLENQSKMNHLMQLLDKRKHLLGKMAQIETVSTKKSSDRGKVSCTENLEVCIKNVSEKLDLQSQCEKEKQQADARTPDDCVVAKSSVRENTINQSVEKVTEHEQSVKGSKQGNANIINPIEETVAEHDIKRSKQSKKHFTIIQLICQSINPWITRETQQYLGVLGNEMENEEKEPKSNLELDEKYQQLCKRLANEEMEIDMIGETSIENEPSAPLQPLPDYTRLKTETEDFAVKVRQFFGDKRGQKETDTRDGPAVYLPTLDNHNQMLIRQNIVMEKLNKMMPELLSPLHLSVQQVFTELRQLVATFNLSSKNILFKPAEWIIICLLLLKMLSRKELSIACAFLNPSAVRHFSTLLQGVGDNLENLDNYVSDLLQPLMT